MSPSRQTADRLLFEELVHETRDDLLAYAMRRAASTEDAADVLSETYLIAWHKLEQVPPGDSHGCGCSESPRTCYAAAPSATDRAKR